MDLNGEKFYSKKIEKKKKKIKVMWLLSKLIQLMEIWESLLTAKVTNLKYHNKALREWGLKLCLMQTTIFAYLSHPMGNNTFCGENWTFAPCDTQAKTKINCCLYSKSFAYLSHTKINCFLYSKSFAYLSHPMGHTFCGED